MGKFKNIFGTIGLGGKSIYNDVKRDIKDPGKWDKGSQNLKTWGMILGGLGTAIGGFVKYFGKGGKK